jgi:hypothetical protein
MDKVKLKEMIKEEVQNLLSEASDFDKYQMIDRTIRELNKGDVSDERARAMAAGLAAIVKALRDGE